MPFLRASDQDQVRTLFGQQLQGRVRLRVLTQAPSKLFLPGVQPCATCGDAAPLAQELAALTDKLEVVVHDVKQEPAVAEQYQLAGLVPAFVLEPVDEADGAAEAAGAGETDGAAEADGASEPRMGLVRFLGLPSGYEFSTLLADIVDLSTGRSELSEAAQAELKALEQDLHLQVFVTPT